MAQLRSALTDWRLYVVCGYVALAVGLSLFTQRQVEQERSLLLAFVCESIALRLEQDGPSAQDFAVRFAGIMRKHHARCLPPVPGLP